MDPISPLDLRCEIGIVYRVGRDTFWPESERPRGKTARDRAVRRPEVEPPEEEPPAAERPAAELPEAEWLRGCALL